MDNFNVLEHLSVEDLDLIRYIRATNSIDVSVIPKSIYLYITDREVSGICAVNLSLKSVPLLSETDIGSKSYLFPVVVENLGRCITYPEFLMVYEDNETKNEYTISIDQIDRFKSYIRNETEARSPVSVFNKKKCIISSVPLEYLDIEKIIKTDNISNFRHKEIYKKAGDQYFERY